MAGQISHWKINTIKHLLENFCSLWKKWSRKFLLSLLPFWEVNARLGKSSEQLNEEDTVRQGSIQLWNKKCQSQNLHAEGCWHLSANRLNRNWETIVFFMLRYGIVYLGWATSHIVSLKTEPSREDKSKRKSISAQFSWKPCTERHVSSTSHRERTVFLGVGRARRRILEDELVPMHLFQEFTQVEADWQLRLAGTSAVTPP